MENEGKEKEATMKNNSGNSFIKYGTTATICAVLAFATLGVTVGLTLNYFLNFTGKDYSQYIIEDYEDDIDALMKRFNSASRSDYLSTFKPYELANIANRKIEQHDYVTKLGIGNVHAIVVDQSIRSYYQKSLNSYFFENISAGVVPVYKRFYQKGNEVKVYKGEKVDIETATWSEPPAEVSNLATFEDKWGRNLSRNSIFIISSKTIIAEQSSATREGNRINLSIELDPTTSVLRYVKQMVATSDLDAPPVFHKMHIDMVLDEELNLLSSTTDELYDVKSFGITAKNSHGSLQEVLTYDVPQELPGLDENIIYTKGE